jgi:hypothetical protein
LVDPAHGGILSSEWRNGEWLPPPALRAKVSYFLAQNSWALALRQNDAWRVEGIGDFLAGKYRPGLPSSNKEPDKG